MVLNKEEIKYIFNPGMLLPGDILLMNTYEENLRDKMKCKYEHAALYLGDAYVVEANGLYVTTTHIYSYAFKEASHACVLRLKKYSMINLESIARSAREQLGRKYINTLQFKSVRPNKESDIKDNSNRSFCSRLVAQSYEREGINLLPNADYCEPDDFLNASLLEEVKDAVIPFSDDMENVVMNNQRSREDSAMDSPNAELFSEMSELYKVDIQDIGQMLAASLSHLDLDETAINIIKKSRMFKHMEDVKRETPWLLDDDSFFEHYKCDMTSGLHFIYSQMIHYDNTIIQQYRMLSLQLANLSNQNSKSKLLAFMNEYIMKMVEEAIECRKRLAHLYKLISEKHKKTFDDFCKEYGYYRDYEYVERPLDIGFMIHDFMKAMERTKKDKLEN